MPQLHLPDVSEFQPNVDWAAVARRNGGAAVIRALYGQNRVDHAWYGGARRADARKRGIKVLGIYQYLVAGQDALAQARAFVQLVGRLEPGEFAVVDVEEGRGSQLARAGAWLDYVDQHLTYPGYRGAWLYAGSAFFTDHGLMPIAQSRRHTWVASYGTTEPSHVPHSLWQHTDREAWPGIGHCDCSVYNGDLDSLMRTVCDGASAGAAGETGGQQQTGGAPPQPGAPQHPGAQHQTGGQVAVGRPQATGQPQTTGQAQGGRALHLANPLLTGPDVEACQRLLAHNRYGDFHPGGADGEYGPNTARATHRARYALGYPDAEVSGGFDERLRELLEGAPLPADFAQRREARLAEAKQHEALRAEIVRYAQWGCANTAQIHYRQSRPIDGYGQRPRLPLYTDCSGFVTLCYEWAGGPDPNGRGFDGYGYTGTLLGHCHSIARSAARPGDLVAWTPPRTGHHVAIVLEPGADPVLASHGSEQGPFRIRFSQEHAFQASRGHATAVWLSCID